MGWRENRKMGVEFVKGDKGKGADEFEEEIGQVEA